MTRAALVTACLLALAACEFEHADEPSALKNNSCTADIECASGELCRSGLCVAPEADRMLEVALQVTPLPQNDTDAPHPVLIEGVSVKTGQPGRRVELPAQLEISGLVRNGGAAIDAAVSFIPSHGVSGIAPAAVTATTSPASNNAESDYKVKLSAGVEYRALVRPVDTSLPPYHTQFTATPGSGLDVDFAELQTREQVYAISNAPADRALLLRALDPKTNEPISSTAVVMAGKATLIFAMEEQPYRLEIRAEQNYQQPSAQSPDKAAGIFCDEDTPVFPIYAIADSDLPPPNRSGAVEVSLPEPPARIRYEGTVALCRDGRGSAVEDLQLPVTLHSTELLGADDSGFSSSFDAKTSAQLDSETGELSFCVQLLEGNYDVVATPPTSMPCAIYAERRLIQAPDMMAASGVQLILPDSAYLQGTVQTSDRTPVAGATVDAVALGRDLALSGQETVLTRFNRSRQVVTGSDGTFKVPVDLGSYDLQVKGPANSGFSWQVQHDVNVGKIFPFSTIVNMSSPVMLSGRLAFAAPSSGQPSLAGAEVLAFAVIRESSAPSTGEFAETKERAVAIGKVMADSEGAFMLLLPQSIDPQF